MLLTCLGDLHVLCLLLLFSVIKKNSFSISSFTHFSLSSVLFNLHDAIWYKRTFSYFAINFELHYNMLVFQFCWVTKSFLEGELNFEFGSYTVSKLSIIMGIMTARMKYIPFKTYAFLEYMIVHKVQT